MDIAAASGLVCREAFHNSEHPANKHVAALLQVRVATCALPPPGWPQSGLVTQAPGWPSSNCQRSAGSCLHGHTPCPHPPAQGGAIGELLSLSARVLIPGWAFKEGDIRFNERLAGGSMMDAVRGGGGPC